MVQQKRSVSGCPPACGLPSLEPGRPILENPFHPNSVLEVPFNDASTLSCPCSHEPEPDVVKDSIEKLRTSETHTDAAANASIDSDKPLSICIPKPVEHYKSVSSCPSISPRDALLSNHYSFTFNGSDVDCNEASSTGTLLATQHTAATADVTTSPDTDAVASATETIQNDDDAITRFSLKLVVSDSNVSGTDRRHAKPDSLNDTQADTECEISVDTAGAFNIVEPSLPDTRTTNTIVSEACDVTPQLSADEQVPEVGNDSDGGRIRQVNENQHNKSAEPENTARQSLTEWAIDTLMSLHDS